MRVIKSKYGELLGCFDIRGAKSLVRVRGRSRSSISRWWKYIFDIFSGKDRRGMREEIMRVVVNREKSEFSSSLWIGATPLKSIFNRLYRLVTIREEKVREFGCWENGE